MSKVICNDGVFLITDEMGDITSGDHGLFYKDTRFLSKYEFKVAGYEFKATSCKSENYFKEINLESENSDLLLRRRSYIHENSFFEQIMIQNRSTWSKKLSISWNFEADFKDIFDIRGFFSGKSGTKFDTVHEQRKIIYSYRGTDGIYRKTVIKCDSDFTLDVILLPDESRLLNLQVDIIYDSLTAMDTASYGNDASDVGASSVASFERGIEQLEKSYKNWADECTQIITDNEDFNKILAGGMKDLRSLCISADGGHTVAAGIPWYYAPFGRDSLITGYFTMMLNPRIARNVLQYLAKHQGKKVDIVNDEEPGKILHEFREGELTKTGQTPFGPYYGTIDATLLFMILLVKYFKWTKDVGFLTEMLPMAEKALAWAQDYGDKDRDGFIKYEGKDDGGLNNKGWKDSTDSVAFGNGAPAKAPIALAEVQGYAYEAFVGMAEIYKYIAMDGLDGPVEGMDAKTAENRASELMRKAALLKTRFSDSFWIRDKNYFALALDGEKKQVDSITSNPGHCLWSGIIDHRLAGIVADRLLSDDMFSGWGIRTMGRKEAAYNPESYHNGSVWPHDNAIIALGLSRYGFKEHVRTVVESIIEASRYFDQNRLPELFCGYDRRSGRPIKYTHGCPIQAWASATPFALLESILGIQANAKGDIILDPALPDSINHITVTNMRVGQRTVNFTVEKETGESMPKVYIESMG